MLNREVNAGLADPTIKARLENKGNPVLDDAHPRISVKLIAKETERWGKVISAANIKPD